MTPRSSGDEPRFGRSREESIRAGLAAQRQVDQARAAATAVDGSTRAASSTPRPPTAAPERRAWFGLSSALRPGGRARGAKPQARPAHSPAPAPPRTRELRAPQRPTIHVPRRPRTAAERRRLRRRLIIAGLVAFAALLLVGVHVVPRLGIFRVREVEVVGTNAVPDAEVREHVQQEMSGRTIYTIDRATMVHRLTALPFVQSASVTTHFPNGVRISVIEYQPLAVGLSGATAWLVARNGRVLTQVRLNEWRGKVPVVDFDARSIHAGQNVGDEPALALLRAMPVDYPYAFRSIELTTLGMQGTLQDPAGTRIRFGDEQQLGQKLAVARLLLGLYGAQRISLQYIDVTVPARPAAKPR